MTGAQNQEAVEGMAVPRPRAATEHKSSPARPLRWRLLVLLTLVAAPAAALMILHAGSGYLRDREELENSLLRIAEIAASEERDLIVGAKQVLLALAGQPAIYATRHPGCGRALQNAFLGLRVYGNIAAFNLDGRPVCSVREPPPGVSVADKAWFQDVLAGQEFVVSELVDSVITNEKAIITAVPLRDEGGALKGALNMTIGAGWLTWLSRITGPMDLSLSALVDDRGVPLDATHLEPERLAKFPPATAITDALRDRAFVFVVPGRDGVERVYAATPLVTDRLYLLIGQEASDFFGWARFDLLAGVAFPLGIWLGVVICIWIGIERLVLRWMARLRRIAAAYAAGDFGARLKNPERAPGEFRLLGDSMAEMATGIERRTQELTQAIDEKNWLIREVHHRVKNNLQIVASLFNLQMRRLSDPDVRAVFADAQNRLNALELVHRTLYEADNLKAINLRPFLSVLATQLIKSRSGGNEQITLQHRIADQWVNPDKAIPLGLLVTEVMTNSLKHGFPGKRAGMIEINLDVSPDGGGILVVRDDGVGAENSTPGFGAQLISAFAKQLGGEAKVEFGPGMTMTVEMPRLLDSQSD